MHALTSLDVRADIAGHHRALPWTSSVARITYWNCATWVLDSSVSKLVQKPKASVA